jgi:hypothetical protein
VDDGIAKLILGQQSDSLTLIGKKQKKNLKSDGDLLSSFLGGVLNVTGIT